MILILVAMLAVQTGASWAKSLFPIVGASGTTALRLTLAAVMLLLVARPWRHPLPREGRLALLGYGVVLGLMNLSFYMSLRTIPLGVAVAVEFTGPLAVSLLASRRAIDFLWPLFAVAGLLLLLPIGLDDKAALDPVGIAFALGAALCWALYIIFGQRAGAAHGASTAALGMAIAAVVIAPVGIAHAGTALLAPALLLPALGVALLASALPNALEMIAMQNLPARTFGVLMSGEPVVAALAGLVLLGERLATTQWLAIGFIIVASLGSVATARTPVVAPNPD